MSWPTLWLMCIPGKRREYVCRVMWERSCDTLLYSSTTRSLSSFIYLRSGGGGTGRCPTMDGAPSSDSAYNYRSFEGQGWMAGSFQFMMMASNWQMDAECRLHTEYKSRRSLFRWRSTDWINVSPFQFAFLKCCRASWLQTCKILCYFRPSDVLFTHSSWSWFIIFCT